MSDSNPCEWTVGPRNAKLIKVTPALERWIQDFIKQKDRSADKEARQHRAELIDRINASNEKIAVLKLISKDASLSGLEKMREMVSLKISAGKDLAALRATYHRRGGWTQLFVPVAKAERKGKRKKPSLPISRFTAHEWMRLADENPKGFSMRKYKAKARRLRPEVGDKPKATIFGRANLLMIAFVHECGEWNKSQKEEMADILSPAREWFRSLDNEPSESPGTSFSWLDHLEGLLGDSERKS